MVQTLTQTAPPSPAAEEQMHIRALWLYFMEGRTQADIADALSTNRLRINRIVNDARRSGLVSITLNSKLTSCVELEQQLCEEFGLKRAVIIPSPEDPALTPVLLGHATADYVMQLLNGSTLKGIGIGWGATLRETVRHMPTMRRPDLSINSVMGGLTRGIEINTFDIASDLARQLSAQCAYLAAPIYTGSAESRAALMTLDIFVEAFEHIAANDIILLSIGDLTERSLLVRYGLPKDITIDELVAAGAVCDVMAQFIDKHGAPIEHPVNQRAIALPLDSLRQVPNVIFTSGGKHKTEAIAAVLQSGLADSLVSDEDTARSALVRAKKLARKRKT
jgi:DNA-binding transcriptional regulator LsrR (DeoR family)